MVARLDLPLFEFEFDMFKKCFSVACFFWVNAESSVSFHKAVNPVITLWHYTLMYVRVKRSACESRINVSERPRMSYSFLIYYCRNVFLCIHWQT